MRRRCRPSIPFLLSSRDGTTLASKRFRNGPREKKKVGRDAPRNRERTEPFFVSVFLFPFPFFPFPPCRPLGSTHVRAVDSKEMRPTFWMIDSKRHGAPSRATEKKKRGWGHHDSVGVARVPRLRSCAKKKRRLFAGAQRRRVLRTGFLARKKHARFVRDPGGILCGRRSCRLGCAFQTFRLDPRPNRSRWQSGPTRCQSVVKKKRKSVSPNGAHVEGE